MSRSIRTGYGTSLPPRWSFYEAVLTVTLASGEEVRMALASDSCAVFLINGMYYDYQPKGDSGQLFGYFDRISAIK